MKKTTLALCCVLAALGGGSVVGEDVPARLAAGVSYLSGGVGYEEREVLRQHSNDYNLRLLFADRAGGHYLAGVKVVIDNDAGTRVLAAESQGPWFFARLPAGRYQVAAEAEGQRQVRAVAVPQEQAAELNFYWP